MVYRTVYLPSISSYTMTDADAYIRSAFTIPKRAECIRDDRLLTGVLVLLYNHNGETIARFTCYPMSAHKNKY